MKVGDLTEQDLDFFGFYVQEKINYNQRMRAKALMYAAQELIEECEEVYN